MDHQAQKTINVTRSSMPSFEEYCAEIRELWDSRWLINVGIKHRSLQSALAEYLEAPRVELLTNEHMAIELSLHALGLRGEVITTPFTFASTTQAIVRCSLTPVFCDIRPDTFCIDASKIEALITPRTCAIVPVHVYGMVCEVEEITRKYGLKVLYDAAHAFGVRYRGQGIGGFGDVSCYSFHATEGIYPVDVTIRATVAGDGAEAGQITFSDRSLFTDTTPSLYLAFIGGVDGETDDVIPIQSGAEGISISKTLDAVTSDEVTFVYENGRYAAKVPAETDTFKYPFLSYVLTGAANSNADWSDVVLPEISIVWSVEIHKEPFN